MIGVAAGAFFVGLVIGAAGGFFAGIVVERERRDAERDAESQ